MSAIVNRITKLVEEKISDDANLFIVDIKVLPNNKVMIFVDGDNGITIQKCAEISRHVGFHLEEENVIDHAYTLEVSSPGIDYPLTLQRQFSKNIGRNVLVKLVDNNKKEGKLLENSENGIKIEETVKEKGKKAQQVEVEIPFSEINEVKVTISFK
ncbi:ribosome maturation factor RimP [Solitalea koreensis]|uniref:Ribosome maturation factor RimP n=1 Tax=Solitalea koreensis TaxID=543615 RepID=A0A521CGQ6_9SPHI|nr:ribosome maturation factor RimP [Solitalea koreensis]SMO58592.1 ribosome maturation factor RimP [Solitalea koreensis]